MSIFFGYLYKKKAFRASRRPYTHTPVHHHLLGGLHHIMCYHSVLSFRAHNPFKLSEVRYFRGVKCSYTNLFLYSKKLKMSIFLVTYIRKNPFELSEVHTRPYTRTPSSARGSSSKGGLHEKKSVLSFCAIILIIVIDIISCAQRSD